MEVLKDGFKLARIGWRS